MFHFTIADGTKGGRVLHIVLEPLNGSVTDDSFDVVKMRKGTDSMQVTVNIKELLILILIATLIVLLIYAIIMISNLIKSLRKVNLVLDDAKIITEVVAKKSEQIDGLLDEANGVALEVVRVIKGNMSTIETLKGIGAGVASVKGIVDKFRSGNDDEAQVKRTKKSKIRK